LIARSGLDRLRLFRFIANSAGELLVGALGKARGLEFIPEHPWMTRLQFLLGWYESETVAVCRKWIRPGMTVLDIGAHTGYFSLLFSRLVGQPGRVYAFEPSERTYRMLLRNVAPPRYSNVVPVPMAAGAQSGATEFFELSQPLVNSLFDASCFVPRCAVRRKVQIECTTVDEFLAAQGNPQIQFIKMDIEGAEPLALAGMRATIARSPQLAMVVEFAPPSCAPGAAPRATSSNCWPRSDLLCM
jgi:FkbM family methyltransferase